jgi:Uma2 family endonuclease
MSTRPDSLLTPQQYLDIERDVPHRSEYYQGRMYAMAGGSKRHNDIVLNIAFALRGILRGKPCSTNALDLRVSTNPQTGLYAYPDVVVICGEHEVLETDSYTVLNPILIAEVLSPSTKNYDRGEKFNLYRKMKSLREYLPVDPETPHIEHFSRQEDGTWHLRELEDTTASIDLHALAVQLPIAPIYE